MKIKRNTKHKCRSVWCMLLAFAMLIGWGTVGVPVLAQETEVPEGFTPIYTPEEFNNIRNDLDGNYILMNDITFQAEDFQDEYGWDPIGTDTDPFTGIFDGNKHTINGLYVNFRTSGYAGLFGYIENGIVENLGLCNSVIISENETPYGQCYVGGIVGGIRGGIIRNCYNADSVVSSYSLSYIGGIAGSAISSEIYSCYNTSNITFYRTNDVYYIGGIVGLFSGTIDRCYNVGDVTASTYEDAGSWGGGIIGAITSNNGDEKNTISHCYNAGNVTCSSSRSSFFVGGILGGEGMFGAVSINDCYNSGNVNADSSGNARGYAGGIAGDIGDYGEQYDVIERCYNIGEVTSSSYEGAIVGRRIGHAEIINCYYLNNISAGVGSGSGDTVSCTYDEMTKQQTYTDFNFTDVWIMSSLEEYPFPILRVNSDIIYHAAVIANCHNTGVVEHWTYEQCPGKYFGDAACTIEIKEITTAIDPNNHDGGTVLKGAVDVGCEINGYTGDCCCAGCGAVLRAGTVITATGHKGVTTVEAQTPTCTETGKTEEIRCSVCDKILQASEPLAALGHSFTNYISDNNATCTENGTETAKCDRCDATDTRTVPGSAQGHEFVKYIADGNAACEADGTATASCKRCGTTETIVIVGSALGHDMEERRTEPGFTFEGAVQNVCDRCGEMEINQILPKKKIETALTDVTSDQWFAYAIGYCLDYKLMQGTSYASDGRQIFLPDTSMTRAELVTVLYNMEGRPEVSYEAVFTDVTENQWFAPQIIWAYRQGIAAGTTKTTFAPDEAITREQIAAILYRYATDYLGLSMSAEDEDALLGAFSDAGEISDYARTAMAAMNQAGVITGDGDRLKPQENATRAEVASMLSRYLPNVLQADQTNG